MMEDGCLPALIAVALFAFLLVIPAATISQDWRRWALERELAHYDQQTGAFVLHDGCGKGEP